MAIKIDEKVIWSWFFENLCSKSMFESMFEFELTYLNYEDWKVSLLNEYQILIFNLNFFTRRWIFLLFMYNFFWTIQRIKFYGMYLRNMLRILWTDSDKIFTWKFLKNEEIFTFIFLNFSWKLYKKIFNWKLCKNMKKFSIFIFWIRILVDGCERNCKALLLSNLMIKFQILHHYMLYETLCNFLIGLSNNIMHGFSK